MAWRIIKQPNGKFARFSEIVDAFTDFDMTEDEALQLCTDLAGKFVAEQKIVQAKLNLDRWDEAVELEVLVSIRKALAFFAERNPNFIPYEEGVYHILEQSVLGSIPSIEIKND